MDTIEVKINTNVKPATDEMKKFRKEIQELRGALIGLEEGTEEYDETLSKLANKQFQLREMNENVRYSVTDLGEQLATVARIGKGVAAGFSTIQGAMQLFGADSENLQKTMVKLQAAMAVVQGLQGLEGLGKDLKRAQIQFSGAIKAVKGFITGLNGMKAALVATGIGALVVAVGLLIANWDKISKLWNDNSPQERAKVAIDKLNSSIEHQDKQLKTNNLDALKKYNEALADAAGSTELINKATDEYNKTLKQNALEQANANLSVAKRAEQETYEAYKKLSDRKRANPDNEVVKAFEEAKASVLKYQEEVVKAENAILLDTQKAEAAKVDAKKKANQQAIDAAKAKANEEAKIKQAELDEIKKFNREIELANMSDEKAEIARLTEEFEEKKALYEKHGKDTAELVKYYGELEKEIKKKYADAAAEETKENIEKQLEAIDGYIDALRNRVSGQLFNLDFSYDNSLAEDDAKMFDFTSEKTKLDNYKEYENQRLAIFSAGIEQENAMLKTKMDTELANTELTESERARIKKQYDDQILANNLLVEQETIASGNRVAKAQTETARKTTQSAVQTATAALSAASSIMSALQEGIDTTTKEGFEKNKKIQIANATIGMLTGVVNAIAGLFTTKSGPWDIALAAIQAATIAATGGIQIANIKKQKFDGGGTSETPNVASMALPAQAFGTQLSDMNEINLQQSIPDTKVYVVESDIANTQNAVRTQVEESTF